MRGVDAANLAELESLIGSTIPNALGTNFSAMRVQAVSQPSAFLLLGMVALLSVGSIRVIKGHSRQS